MLAWKLNTKKVGSLTGSWHQDGTTPYVDRSVPAASAIRQGTSATSPCTDIIKLQRSPKDKVMLRSPEDRNCSVKSPSTYQ